MVRTFQNSDFFHPSIQPIPPQPNHSFPSLPFHPRGLSQESPQKIILTRKYSPLKIIIEFLNCMGRQQKKQSRQGDKEVMGKVYRQFSRQKYNKYKHQYPKMREAEIVSKIIKEWDALNSTAKTYLQKIYEKNKVLTLEDISSSEQIMKRKLMEQEDARIQAGKAKISSSDPIPITKIFPAPSGVKNESDSDFNRNSQKDDSNKPVDSSSPKLVIRKTKKIVKTDYLSFYKANYEKLHAEHPRWTSLQISGIVRLKWKKEKSNFKKTGKASGRLGIRRSSKILSGFRYYRKYRGLGAKECLYKWRRFPYETKNYWCIASGKKKPQAKKDHLTLRDQQAHSLGFLGNKLTRQ